MPLFSAVLNLFRGSETSPPKQEGETPLTTANVSPGKSPKLLQKLNRMHGNSIILQECNKDKKRTREFSSDDEENALISQKRRRVYASANDDLENSNSDNATTSDNVDDSNCSENISSCSSVLEENQNSLVSIKSIENARIKRTHAETGSTLNTDTKLNSSRNETATKYIEKPSSEIKCYQYDEDILYNEKDVGTSMSDLIINTQSEKSPKFIAERSEVNDVGSLDNIGTKVDEKTPEGETVMETRMDEVFSTSSPSTSVKQEPEEMECTGSSTSTSEDDIQATSSAMHNSNCTSTSEDENQPTTSIVFDNSKDYTKNHEDAGDNQLVPDVICGEDKSIATHNDQKVTKTEDEVNANIILSYDKQRDDKNGDQVVALDENNNEQHVRQTYKTEEEEEKMQEQLIAKQISKGVLTDSMLDQEKRLHQEHLKEEKDIVTKAMEEWETTVEKQRYTRLQHLLQKSNVYSTFLLQRIEEQKGENEKKKLREAKKAEKAKKEDHKELPQTVPDTKRGRGTRKQQTDYNITDYVDTEALKKNSEESIAIPCVPDKDDNKKFSIGHHSKETDTPQTETRGYQKPLLFTGGSLRDYQIEGVEWMKVLFENGVNGILADEMGLGKTIQCIALVAHLIEKGVRGPFLVAAPLSTLPNWIAEFKRFAPNICALIYHGRQEERASLRKKFSKLHGDTLKSFPVAITSYEIIMRDRKELVKFMWKYLIVDEGHRIKNLKCRLVRELKAFPTANRLLLTGTPLQNNLSELWSLLNFLLPDIFNDLDSFQAWFDFSAISESDGSEKIIAQEREHHVLERLHEILTPFLLRRLKSDVSIDIPRKKEVIVYAPLTQKQKDWYELLLDKTRLVKELNPNEEATPSYTPSGRTRRRCNRNMNYSVFDSDKINYEDLAKILAEEDERKREAQPIVATPPTCDRNVTILNIIMMLRKTCNHPYLLEYPLNPETQDYRIDEEVITSCGKTLVLDQMLTELKRRGHKVLLFSQMTKLLDILEDFCYLRKYKFSRIDGSMDFEVRQAQIEDFNSDPDVFIFLLSTRAGGLGLNLTAADTVIIYDSAWNPQQDLQAQDRCHRIGQTKPVVVYRILTANTVDQRIVERANEKRMLEKMVIHKEKFKGRRDEKKLTTKELMELLQSSDHQTAINHDDITNTQVLSTVQLNKLLDRSDLLSGNTTISENTEEENKLFKVIGIAE